MTWSAEIRGHEFDLLSLAESYRGPDLSVDRSPNGSFYLTSASFSGLPSALEVRTVAQGLLNQVNGAAKILRGSYEPVELTGQFRHGETQHAVVAPDTITIRTRMSSVTLLTDDGHLPKAPSDESRFLGIAAGDSSVHEALTLLGTGELDWSRLYKVYEIIRDDLGDQKSVENL